MGEPKTEEPTPRKLREARRRGEVAQSRELTSAAVAIVALIALSFWWEQRAWFALESCFSTMAAFALRPSSASAVHFLHAASTQGLNIAGPVLGFIFFSAFVASFLQVGPMFSAYAFSFRAERISLGKGLSRVRERIGIDQVLVGLKFIGCATLVAAALLNDTADIANLVRAPGEKILNAAVPFIRNVLFRVVCLLLVWSVVDFAYRRLRYRKQQRMTPVEVRRERREEEGDPLVRRQRGEEHRRVVHQAASQSVESAQLVIWDAPVAIAVDFQLQWGDAPPVVVSKAGGTDAATLLARARTAGVPIFSPNSPLPEHARVRPGQPIPVSWFSPVAELLHRAWRERDARS